MKRRIKLLTISVLVAVFTITTFAQDQSKTNKQTKKMVKAQSSLGTNTQSANWIDADGDGVCDNFGTSNQGQGNGKGYGLKDGSGAGARPQDGTGFGKLNGGGNGTGTCDGTGSGSKGSQKRSGNK
jgi:hypothetical protein